MVGDDRSVVGTVTTTPNFNWTKIDDDPLANGFPTAYDAFLGDLDTRLKTVVDGSAAWTSGTAYALGKLVTYSGVIYSVSTAHTSTGAFDSSKFTPLTLATSLTPTGPGGSAGAAMGSAQTIDQGGGITSIWDGTLTNATECTIDFTGFPASSYGETLVRVHQPASSTVGTLVISGVDLWVTTYAPVLPTVNSGLLEFTVYSIDGGTTKIGVHGQKIRTHTLPSGDADTTGNWLEYFETDARIVKVRPSCGGVPVSTAAKWDLNKGAGNGSASSIYTTTANQPTVAAGSRTNTSVALPDTTLIAPGDYLTADIDTRSSATGMSLTVTTVEA